MDNFFLFLIDKSCYIDTISSMQKLCYDVRF